jgi:polyphosphate glucokinase
MMTDKKRTKLGFESGPGLSAKAMVKKVAELTADWTYDVVSVGYPGPVVHDRPTTQPYNLGKPGGRDSISREPSGVPQKS